MLTQPHLDLVLFLSEIHQTLAFTVTCQGSLRARPTFITLSCYYKTVLSLLEAIFPALYDTYLVGLCIGV